MLRLFPVIGLALVFAVPVSAQQVTFGADLVSRYVWRGYDFGSSASLQPVLAYTYEGTEVGTWASYALVPDGALADEHDLWLSHAFDLGGGSATVGLTSYYFPTAGADFFDLSGDGEGAHYLEPFLKVEGPEGTPIHLLAAAFVYNDPDHSVYLEAGYPFRVAETDLRLAAGVVPAESALYGTAGAAVTHLGLTASRDLVPSEDLTVPVSVGYVLNPYAEQTYLVFGIGLRVE